MHVGEFRMESSFRGSFLLSYICLRPLLFAVDSNRVGCTQ